MMNKSVLIPSPDKKHKAILDHLGTSRSGRDYYSLTLDGILLSLQNRVFGRTCLWSHDSRFLALQEWKAGDPPTEPGSYLLVILDLLTRQECIVAEVDRKNSEINPQEFMGDSLMYTVFYEGPFGITKNFESNFQHLTGWQAVK
jgi:hypothetical protein